MMPKPQQTTHRDDLKPEVRPEIGDMFGQKRNTDLITLVLSKQMRGRCRPH